jgi:hypothetical protein
MYSCPSCRKTYQSRQGLRNHLSKGACRASSTPQQMFNAVAPATETRSGRLILTGRHSFIGSKVREAMQQLGIRSDCPIVVKMTGGCRTLGTTRYDSRQGYIITVSHKSPSMSNTLWHELTHVKQAEDFGGWASFLREYGRYSTVARQGQSHYSNKYRANPYEVEARTVADNGFELTR